jgi:hypothetical protein
LKNKLSISLCAGEGFINFAINKMLIRGGIMKKFKICLGVFLSVIGLMVLPSSAFALQSGGDIPVAISSQAIELTPTTTTTIQKTTTTTILTTTTTILQQQYGDFTYTVNTNNTVTITKYSGAGGTVIIPSTINSMPVVGIGSSAFSSCTGLASVVIPDSVTSIGDTAFEYCSSLTSVTIPNSVTSIGAGVFGYCSGLTSVTIGNSVTSIGHGAFGYCSGLTSVTIGRSVTNIGSGAFAYCSSLTSVTIPNSVTSIGWNAFYNCQILNKSYFLGNAPSMGSGVFDNCASNFSVCYTAGATGFTTPTWCPLNNPCYPAGVCEATLIELASFTATPKSNEVILEWSTESETDNAGFNIYRSESENGQYTKINDTLIPAQGSSTQGASYEFTDKDVQNRKTYYYKLEDIDLNGTSTMHGPVSATPRLIYGIGK